MPARLFVFAAILNLAAALSGFPAAAQVLHVDQDATGPVHDGGSWCTAFTQLYEALAIANSGATIRIADGHYLPDVTGLIDPREATFSIAGGLTIIGGYAGCGASYPDERNPFLYITELSGDLAGDDSVGVIDDNAYHVVTASAMDVATMLGGLVIRGGNTRETGLGGGILAQGGRLVLSACLLTENRAWRGGAIYIEAGELHLFQCRLTANQTTGEGGSIFQAGSSLEAHNCLFAANLAESDGGAIFSDLGSSDFFNCSFGDNHSEWRGGAIYDYVGVATYAGNCIFWGNSDQTGSGETAQLFINPSNSLDIDYSCVEGWTGGFGGEGNIGDDPILVDLLDGDLHLMAGSPCIDSGSNELVGAQLDLDGNLRIINDRVDMGCYEFQGITSIGLEGFDSPLTKMLRQNHPNPFNPQTTISFTLPHDGWAKVAIYALTGKCVAVLADHTFTAGPHTLSWNGRDTDGRDMPSGAYLVCLETEDGVEARKVSLIR